MSALASATKTAVRSGIAVALSDGTVSDLAVNLASAAMAASMGSALSDVGSDHGQHLTGEQPATSSVRLTANALLAASPARTRRSGLIGSDFEHALNAAHRRTQEILFDAELERSFNHITDIQPVLLWDAPRRHKHSEELNWETRALGALQALGGSAQIAASLVGALISAPTVIGPTIATAVGTMGADNIMTGLHTLWTGESQQTMLFRALNALGEETNLYGSQGASNIETALNLISCVNPKSLLLGYRSGVGMPTSSTTAFSELRAFAAERTFRCPITIEYDPNKLYSGLPVDLFKLQKPWVKKDILSETARLHPSPLLVHEERIIEQWTMERVRLLAHWKVQDVSAVNEKMYDLLNKCHTQLRVRMTPDDLAAIMKEQRGIKILKSEGGTFEHLTKEWKQAQQSFKKAFNGPWSGNLEEARVLNENFGDLSRLWDRFEKLIERAKCNPEIKKLKS